MHIASQWVLEHFLFHTADVADLRDELAAYDVVFLAALVGMAAEDQARS